jgi:hypothetical protein
LKEMPHLVEAENHRFAGYFRLGEFGCFALDPVVNAHMGYAQNAGDHAVAHVSHAIQKEGKRLHLRWFSARRRHGEIAAARAAAVTLHLPHNTALNEVGRATALAANFRHSGLLIPFATNDLP